MSQDRDARAVEKGISRFVGKSCAFSIVFFFAMCMGFIVFLAWLFGKNGLGIGQ